MSPQTAGLHKYTSLKGEASCTTAQATYSGDYQVIYSAISTPSKQTVISTDVTAIVHLIS